VGFSQLSNADHDRLAAGLSSLCLLHCVALPIVLGLLPAIASGPLEALHGPDWAHWALIVLAVPFSLAALRKGMMRHANPVPAIAALAGFGLVAMGALLHGAGAMEQLATVSGGLVIAAAHWRNWRLRSFG